MIQQRALKPESYMSIVYQLSLIDFISISTQDSSAIPFIENALSKPDIAPYYCASTDSDTPENRQNRRTMSISTYYPPPRTGVLQACQSVVFFTSADDLDPLALLP